MARSDQVFYDQNDRIVLPDAGRKRRSGKRAWAVFGIIVGVLALAYVGTALALADRVPRGTTVAGIDIGSLSSAEATKALTDALAELTDGPLVVTLGDKEASIAPQSAGLEFLAAETVQPLVGFTLDPTVLWRHVIGGGAVTPQTVVDTEAVSAAVAGLAQRLETPAVDGGLVFVDGAPVVTAAAAGVTLDVDQAVAVISEQWLTGNRPLPLPPTELAPEISDDEVQRALKDSARPLVVAPVSIAHGATRTILSPQLLADAATFSSVDGRLRLILDGEALAREVIRAVPDVERAPENASLELVDGQIVKTPAKSGRQIDRDALARRVVGGVENGQRTIELPLEVVEADVTTEDIDALGIVEQISEFATPLTADQVRTNNLRVGASKINGVILMPGETFSLLEHVGPITEENGYGQASVIRDGLLTRGTGGGLSQVATTLYNAVFFAGLEDVYHKPHSLYFSRYPEGREATISDPTVDLKFRNDSEHGVLIQAWLDSGQIHVVLWGTKEWEIKAGSSGRTKVVPPKTVYSNSSKCVPGTSGQPGFTVTTTREFWKDDEMVKSEKSTWRYLPQNKVVCRK